MSAYIHCTALHCSRQIEELNDKQAQLNISSGQKVEEVRQEGEKKISFMKQQLREEQVKSKQKEDEIAELRRYIYCVYSMVLSIIMVLFSC